MNKKTSLALLLSLAAIAQPLAHAAAQSQPAPAASPSPAKKTIPDPTFANVPYGPLPQQTLDFWKADTAKPAPLAFIIHGGGWMNGNKNMEGNSAYSVPVLLKAGISVVSIDYRMLSDAKRDGVMPPVKYPLEDAKRALQFVRSKAAEWNIDKDCIGAGGSSAGACTSLWLAFHPDMADPKSGDPVARESTRLACVAVVRPQTSLDPQEMKEWIPNMNYGGQAFGFWDSKPVPPFDQFLAAREKMLPWIREYSPYGLVTKDAPPVYMFYNTAPAMGQPQKSQAHSANFGVKLQEKLRGLGVQCELVYPGATDVKYSGPLAFLIPALKACERKHPDR